MSSSRGGVLTIIVALLCVYLTWRELLLHLDGTVTQAFTVEPTVGHVLQINLDITVAMPCDSLHVNVQDAAMDHIMAGQLLHKEPASLDRSATHHLAAHDDTDLDEHHVYGVLANAKKSKFKSSSSWRSSLFSSRAAASKGCRIYGSMSVNKVMGDFHITAVGHGYAADAGSTVSHVDHSTFNFSHVIHELSFGEYFPKLVNPLDDVEATTEDNFYRFQYYLNIVPTIYHSESSQRSVLTNQYAVTEHSRKVPSFQAPGIFFKFDIEPMTLTINERRMPFSKFAIRIVNIVGGVLVGGNWAYKLVEMFVDFFARKKRSMDGMINGIRH